MQPAQPDDIAHPVAFLPSPESSFITAHVLTADGGPWTTLGIRNLPAPGGAIALALWLGENSGMAKTEIKHPDKAVSTGAYSAGVAVDGWLYISGQGPLDLKTGEIVEGTIQEQTRLTLEHIGKVLEAAGCGFEDVVKCTCHLRDINDFDAFNSVYAGFFTGIRPARTTVQSVLWGTIKVEIDAIARLRS